MCFPIQLFLLYKKYQSCASTGDTLYILDIVYPSGVEVKCDQGEKLSQCEKCLKSFGPCNEILLFFYCILFYLLFLPQLIYFGRSYLRHYNKVNNLSKIHLSLLFVKTSKLFPTRIGNIILITSSFYLKKYKCSLPTCIGFLLLVGITIIS